MRGRRKEAKKAARDAKERAVELKDQAKEVAGQSGEALNAFAHETGVAAKDFAHKAKEAAKELVDAIDKAAKGVTEPEPRKARKVLKATLAIGAGVAVLSNEKARNAISSVIRKSTSGGDTPEIWRPETPASATNSQKTAASIAEETS